MTETEEKDEKKYLGIGNPVYEVFFCLFLFCLAGQIMKGLDIAVKAESLERLDTGGPDIGNFAKFLSGVGIGKMNFHRGNANGFHGVQ